MHRLSTLAVIPARGGSKGIPHKNLRLLRGRTLVARAIQIGLATCSRTVVTTDDERIAKEATLAGAGFVLRPAALAGDTSPMLPVVQHAIRGVPADVIVLLQPTQPARKPVHVLEAVALLDETGADSVVSVVQVPPHYSPDYVLRLQNGALLPWEWDLPIDEAPVVVARRQDARPAYSRDGTVYAVRREIVERGSLYGDDCRALVIPAQQSVNIDDEFDFARAERMVTS